MKQLRLCLGVVFSFNLILWLPVQAFADTSTKPLLISEIKIKNDTNGYDEFIELVNVSASNISLAEFNLEYFNSPSPSADSQPVEASVGSGLLEPGKSYVLAKNEGQIQNSHKSPFSSLSDSGGQIRLTDLEGNIYEQISWTNTQSLAISPVLYMPSSASAKSFERGTDGNGNLLVDNPTWSLTAPSPMSSSLLPAPQPEPDPEPETEQPTPTGEIPQTPTPETPATDPSPAETTDTSNGRMPLQISELLPNPAAPASDATDEYIELYNPNDEVVDISGYRLQTGNTYSYNHTFSGGTLQPHEYHAFYVTETDTLLANSGGRARLLDPGGQVVSETDAYGEANEGMAWAYISGAWQWTISPTPNTTNLLGLPIAKTAKAAAAKAAAKPKTAAKTAPAKKAKASTAKAKSTKTNGAGAAGLGDDSEPPVNSLHPGIIAGVGLIALGYAAYEYRHDLQNRVYQFRRNRAARRAARLAA